MEFARKLKAYKELGFDAVQFHDDDIVPADLDWQSTTKGVAEVKKILDGEGLFVEIVAPRLWEDPRTLDGAFTSNNPSERKYAIDRSKRCVDIAREVGCKNYVLWLAREGTYIRRPRTAGRPSPGSSTPGIPSSNTTRKSECSARQSPTSRWIKPICRPWDIWLGSHTERSTPAAPEC